MGLGHGEELEIAHPSCIAAPLPLASTWIHMPHLLLVGHPRKGKREISGREKRRKGERSSTVVFQILRFRMKGVHMLICESSSTIIKEGDQT